MLNPPYCGQPADRGFAFLRDFNMHKEVCTSGQNPEIGDPNLRFEGPLGVYMSKELKFALN